MKHQRFLLHILIVFAGISLIQACKLIPSSKEALPWNAGVLAPLAKTNITINDLNDLSGATFVQQISSTTLGFPNGLNATVPPLSGVNAGPFVLSVSSEFDLIATDSISLTITIDNNMPVDIAPGTELRLNNHTTGSLFYSYILAQTIAPGASFSFNIKLLNASIDSDIDFNLINFSSDGSATPVTFNNSNITVTFALNFLLVNHVITKVGATFAYSDTSSFTAFNNFDVNNSSGNLKLFVSNGFPMEGHIQLYFLDAGKNKIDSLFDIEGFIPSAPTSGGVATGRKDTVYLFPFTPSRIQNLKNSSYVYFKRNLNTPSLLTSYTIDKTDSTIANLVIDANINVTKP